VEGSPRRYAYSELGPGRVQVEFAEGPKGDPDGH
jgi:hypothetical protein